MADQDKTFVTISVEELIRLAARPIAEEVVVAAIKQHEHSCGWHSIPLWKVALYVGLSAGSTGGGAAVLFNLLKGV